MRLTFRLAFLGTVLVLSACTRTDPANTNGDEKLSGKETKGSEADQSLDKKADLRASKPWDYVPEFNTGLGQVSVGALGGDVPFWMREGFSVIVARGNWPGRKGVGPIFVIVARHPLPKSLDDPAMHHGGSVNLDATDSRDEQLRLTGGLRNCKTSAGYDFVLTKQDAKEDFTLRLGNHVGWERTYHSSEVREFIADFLANSKGTKYNLAEGRLFLADLSVNPPRIEQVKADVGKMAANKESCVAMLGELAPKSEVAKSLLEETQRR
jgi:hypothetical protein